MNFLVFKMDLEAEVGYNMQGEIDFDVESGEGQALVRKKRMCSLCDGYKRNHTKKHVLAAHLPWYIKPTSACWDHQVYVSQRLANAKTFGKEHSTPHTEHFMFEESIHCQLWCQLMYGILIFWANLLQLRSVGGLLDFVLDQRLYPLRIPDDANFDEDEIKCLKKLCGDFELTVPETFVISPPNHVVSILHWKILMNLLKYTGHSSSEFKAFSFRVPRPPLLRLRFIDSHCHLDKIMETETRKFSVVKADLSLGKPNLQFCISNFVFPRRWFTMEVLLSEPLVKKTIGVHPHAVEPGKEQKQVSMVADMLDGGGFIGVGEVGLDFHFGYCKCSPPCKSKEACIGRKRKAQLLFLHGVLPLANQHNLTLVLHCRDNGDGAALKEVRNILISKRLTHLRIHLHCFIGSLQEMQTWLVHFPNVMFGISAKSLKDAVTKETLTKLPLDKILIETDAPYLRDQLETDTPGFEESALSPWDVYLIAWNLADELKIALHEVVSVCNQNVFRLYGLTN